MINIIFLFCLYPFLFLMYFIQKGEGKSKYGTLFGIKYSNEWLSNDEREQLEADYRRTMNRYLLVLSIVPIITFFISYFSISFSIWMIWMIAVIVMCMLPYYKGNQKLAVLKKERYKPEATDTIVYTELKNAGIRCVKWQQFLPPVALSILLAVFTILYFQGQNLAVYEASVVIFALCTPLFYVCAIYMDKTKSKVISNDSTINANYARASKKINKSFWLICSWLNNAFIVILLITMVLETSLNIICSYVILWGTIIYSIVIIILGMRMLNQQHSLTQQYEKHRSIETDNDEEHWIGGMFYYNPKDKHTMVSKRVGIGTTVNMATPGGKIFMVISALSLLIIPISCVWVILLEFTPISLFVNDDVLIARHLRNDYVIATDTITEITLEEELPRSSKINGTGMDALEKGQFRNSIDGRIQMFLNPQNQYYLRIVSEDTIYYFGGYDDEETLAVYDLLTAE